MNGQQCTAFVPIGSIYIYIYNYNIYIYIHRERERDSQLMSMCQNVHKVFISGFLSPGYIRLSLSQLTQVAFAF